MYYCSIHIELKNEAFVGENRSKALADTLRQLADQIEKGSTYRRILDPNGSYCGKLKILKQKGSL